MAIETWDAAIFEQTPPGSEGRSFGDDRIRSLKENVRERAETEHEWGTSAGSDTGRHRLGSARAFYQTASPSAIPVGDIAASTTLDQGRLWVKDTDKTLYVNTNASGATWSAIKATPSIAIPGSNRLSNSLFRYAQRVDPAGSTTVGSNLAAPTFVLDRWAMVNTSGATVTATTDYTLADTPTLTTAGIVPNCTLKLTSSGATGAPGANDTVIIYQPIEGYFVQDLFGRTLTFSAWVKLGWLAASQDICVFWRSYNDQLVALDTVTIANNSWTQITSTITLPAYSSGNWNISTGRGLAVGLCLVAGSSRQSAEQLTMSASLGSYYGTNTMLTTTAVLIGAGSQTFHMCLPRLEIGDSVGQPELIHPALDLEHCQRYYQKSYDVSTAPGSNTQTGSVRVGERFEFQTTNSGAVSTVTITETLQVVPVEFHTRMRSAPSANIWSTNGAPGFFWHASEAASHNDGISISASESGLFMSHNYGLASVATGATLPSTTGSKDSVIYFHWSADAEIV